MKKPAPGAAVAAVPGAGGLWLVHTAESLCVKPAVLLNYGK